jgi:hypothetical protein
VLTTILNLAQEFVLQRFKIPRKARFGLSGVVFVQSEPAHMSTPMEDGWCPGWMVCGRQIFPGETE